MRVTQSRFGPSSSGIYDYTPECHNRSGHNMHWRCKCFPPPAPHPLHAKAKTAVGKSHGTLRMLAVCESKDVSSLEDLALVLLSSGKKMCVIAHFKYQAALFVCLSLTQTWFRDWATSDALIELWLFPPRPPLASSASVTNLKLSGTIKSSST